MRFARDDSSSSKPQWLLIKHRDEFATKEDVVAENMTSVESGRTMEEIASGKSRVWRSNREPKRSKTLSPPRLTSKPSARAPRDSAPRETTGSASQARFAAAALEPMYASIGSEVPGKGWTFEPKSETECDVGFYLAYEFKSRMLALLMGAMFDTAFGRFSAAFEKRADAIYGKG